MQTQFQFWCTQKLRKLQIFGFIRNLANIWASLGLLSLRGPSPSSQYLSHFPVRLLLLTSERKKSISCSVSSICKPKPSLNWTCWWTGWIKQAKIYLLKKLWLRILNRVQRLWKLKKSSFSHQLKPISAPEGGLNSNHNTNSATMCLRSSRSWATKTSIR